MYGIPLVERRFRGEIDYWIGEYRSVEAEIRRLNDQLDGLTLRLNRIQSELSNISLLETDYNTELKKAYEDLDVAIDGVKGVINKYRPILGSEALVVEDTMLDLLKKYKTERSQHQERINQLNSQITSLQQESGDLNKKLEEISKLPVILWESDFRDGTLNGFRSATIENGNPDVPADERDALAKPVQDSSAPAGTGYALQLIANVQRRKGVWINAMTHRDIIYRNLEKDVEDKIFRLGGAFKKQTNDMPIQNISVNLQLVKNFSEYASFIQWVLDPMHPDNGWLTYRVAAGDKRLHKIGDDNLWHYFEIEASYSKYEKILRKVTIDTSAYNINSEMLYVPNNKSWKESFAVLLETTNWGGLGPDDPRQPFVAESRWSKINVVRLHSIE